MKIIISHDVDHLSAYDHLLKDLILPKLWIRSFLHLCGGKISWSTFLYRISILFHPRMHRIQELMAFDLDHKIPSVFFFGMKSALGMSYTKKAVAPVIQQVLNAGFDVGVHGVDYQNFESIQWEHDAFKQLSGISSFGIRNHYVRFDTNTIEKMAQAGYFFDSTQFNKKELEFSPPYKVGNMWEFPLYIMDGYICKPGELEQGLVNTFSAIQQAENQGMPYCTILFHDYLFHDRYNPQMKQWYEGTIQHLQENNYEFISYQDAIRELEGANEYHTLRQ